jgi:hypothetical protein
LSQINTQGIFNQKAQFEPQTCPLLREKFGMFCHALKQVDMWQYTTEFNLYLGEHTPKSKQKVFETIESDPED